MKQTLDSFLSGPWIQELKDYLSCIEEKYVPQTNPNDISKDDLITNTIGNDNAIDAKDFLKKSLKLAESKDHSPNGDGFSKLQKRDDGYSAGHCGTFAIFPFLAFLASAVASSLTVMANVNTNINNNNNNNNINMNMNENMNMNMNSRSFSIREAGIELEDDIHVKTTNANKENPANLARSQREANEDLNLAGLMGEAAGVIIQNSKSFIPGTSSKNYKSYTSLKL